MKTQNTMTLPLSRQSVREVQAFSEDRAKKIIRDLGLKVTGQRILILQILHSGAHHITAQELFENVVKKDSSIGFATVYRFLRDLTVSGFVTELRMGGASARYELVGPKHHDHLTCLQCGQIYEFENQKIESLQQKVAEEFGFELKHHVLELYGVCRKCRSAANI